MSEITGEKPSLWYWLVSIVALLWNLAGVSAYLVQATMSPEALAEMEAAERALYENIPAWVTSAYAIAVFGGAAASVALLLRKKWAFPMFIVSMIAILAQMSYSIFMTNAMEVYGVRAVIMPGMVIFLGAVFIWFAHMTKNRGWLT